MKASATSLCLLTVTKEIGFVGGGVHVQQRHSGETFTRVILRATCTSLFTHSDIQQTLMHSDTTQRTKLQRQTDDDTRAVWNVCLQRAGDERKEAKSRAQRAQRHDAVKAARQQTVSGAARPKQGDINFQRRYFGLVWFLAGLSPATQSRLYGNQAYLIQYMAGCW